MLAQEHRSSQSANRGSLPSQIGRRSGVDNHNLVQCMNFDACKQPMQAVSEYLEIPLETGPWVNAEKWVTAMSEVPVVDTDPGFINWDLATGIVLCTVRNYLEAKLQKAVTKSSPSWVRWAQLLERRGTRRPVSDSTLLKNETEDIS